MKKTDISKKQDTAKSGVVHIDGNVHQKLKIYCATNNVDMGKYATEELMESLKKKGVKF
jgi:ABC-type sugar transport system substrate-binding protein